MSGGVADALLRAARPAGSVPVAVEDGPSGDRVGPNAVIQTRAALIEAQGSDRARSLFTDASLGHWFETPPDRMVPADKVHRLNSVLLAAFDGQSFEAVMRDAGRRTGRYILENRIPGPARLLLKMLPARLAVRVLLKAIRSNSWTFAGRAEVRVTPGNPAIIEIAGNPLPMPGCPWHAAVFETLFSALLSRPVRVGHRLLSGDLRQDRFELCWHP